MIYIIKKIKDTVLKKREVKKENDIRRTYYYLHKTRPQKKVVVSIDL